MLCYPAFLMSFSLKKSQRSKKGVRSLPATSLATRMKSRVVATWKRTLTRRNTVVQVRPLRAVTAMDRARITTALQAYARFVGLPLALCWP